MGYCLLRGLFITDNLSRFANLIERVISTVEAKPIPLGNPMVECGVTVDVTAVEITTITYEENVLIVSKPTLVTSIVIVLCHQYELSCFYFHFFCLYDASTLSLS